jgi:hypothetical protein
VTLKEGTAEVFGAFGYGIRPLGSNRDSLWVWQSRRSTQPRAREHAGASHCLHMAEPPRPLLHLKLAALANTVCSSTVSHPPAYSPVVSPLLLGCEVAVGQRVALSNQKVAFFTWHGATVEVQGKPDIVYVDGGHTAGRVVAVHGV